MLTDKQAIELNCLVKRLYEKYPDYVHCDITYSTETNRGTTLPPKKEMKLNIYTPIINHNSFCNLEDFRNFVEKILADGINSVRVKILEEQIVNCTKNISNNTKVMKNVQEELDRLKEKEND